jgi:type IX secretion system PorP/SprF family membrane protein
LKKQFSILVSLVFLACVQVKAQDIHFSQFFSTPLTISPSNTGNYTGDWRVMANYRTQWKEIAKPYNTQSIAGDMQFYVGADKISAGLLIVNDRSGGTFQVNKIQLSGAYHKVIGKNSLHFGIQPGFTMKSISKNETFPDQFNWTSGKFDSGMNNQETNLSLRLNYFDLNAGVGYDYKFKKVEIFISYGAFHINYPKETFLGYKNILKPRHIGSLGFTWYCAKRITVQPSMCVVGTDKASEFLYGSRMFYSLDGDYTIAKSIFIGAYARKGFSNLNDAIFAVLGMNYKQYYGGVSYDFNISQLKTATNYRGALEFSFIYTGISTRLSKIAIPCDRY